MSGKTGDRYERQLVNMLYDEGFGSLRIPSSGAATAHELPDVFAHINGTNFAMEVKYTSGDYASFDGEEVRELITFADRWNAEPMLVARFSQDTVFYWKKAYDFADLEKSETRSMKRHERDDMPIVRDLFPR